MATSQGSGKKLIFEEFGSPRTSLKLADFPLANLQHGEVAVRLLAAPINPADLNTIEGTYGVKPALPATPGIEGCGEVTESRSPDFFPGDRVIFLRRASSWASHAVMPAGALFKIPATIDPLQAAILKVNPATAWRLLHGFGKPPEGSFIVQNAGNSAVSRCVIQLAPALGIRTISFVRRAELINELKTLGADHVFLDDADGQAAAEAAMDGKNAALAFNSVGGESALRLMNLLKSGGIHITYGAMGRRPLTLPNGLLIFRDLQIRGLWITQWLENAPPEEIHHVYHHLAELVATGKLVQPVDATYPLEDFANALTRLTAPDRSGKVLFTM
ncbi:MAG: 2-enoyl thioester reductase domain-containing protein [Luteolibacter sp.]